MGKNIYWLDGNDKIILVSPSWDQFALDNDGEHVISSDILGKTIWEFVHGDVTRMWLETLFTLARLRGTPVVRPYRCDSPNIRRYMSLNIALENSNVLRVEHIILSTEPREIPVYMQAAKRLSTNFNLRCSICGRMEFETSWVEPEDHPGAENKSQAGSFQVIYTVCKDCYR